MPADAAPFFFYKLMPLLEFPLIHQVRGTETLVFWGFSAAFTSASATRGLQLDKRMHTQLNTISVAMCGPHGTTGLGGFNTFLEYKPKPFHTTFRRELQSS